MTHQTGLVTCRMIDVHPSDAPVRTRYGPDHPPEWFARTVAFLEELIRSGHRISRQPFDDHDGRHVLIIGGMDEKDLLQIAWQAAAIDGVPGGTFSVLTDDDAVGPGRGIRVALPLDPTAVAASPARRW